MENTKTENGNAENVNPIPYNNTDNIQIEYNNMLTAFNEICVSLPKAQKLTDARKKAIKAVIPLIDSRGDPVEAFSEVFRAVEASNFLCGRNTNTSFRASFDWIMNKKNIVKIIEGNYSDTKAQAKKEGWGEWL
jgi:hypothetical protein